MAAPQAYSKYSQVSSAPLTDDRDTYPTAPQYQTRQRPPPNPGGEHGFSPIPPEPSFNTQSYAPPLYTPHLQPPVQPQEGPQLPQINQNHSRGSKIWEPSSLCCLSLSTGSYVVAATIIGLGISSSVYAVTNIPDLHHMMYLKCEREHAFPTVYDCMSLLNPIGIGIIIFKLIFVLLQMVFSCCLMQGVRMNKTKLLMPFMIWTSIGIVILIIVAFGVIGLLLYLNDFGSVICAVLVFSIIAFLETYVLLVIRALYFQLKRTKMQPCTAVPMTHM